MEATLGKVQQEHSAKATALQAQSETLESRVKAHRRDTGETRERTKIDRADLEKRQLDFAQSVTAQTGVLEAREHRVSEWERKIKAREEKVNSGEQALADRLARLKEIAV